MKSIYLLLVILLLRCFTLGCVTTPPPRSTPIPTPKLTALLAVTTPRHETTSASVKHSPTATLPIPHHCSLRGTTTHRHPRPVFRCSPQGDRSAVENRFNNQLNQNVTNMSCGNTCLSAEVTSTWYMMPSPIAEYSISSRNLEVNKTGSEL